MLCSAVPAPQRGCQMPAFRKRALFAAAAAAQTMRYALPATAARPAAQPRDAYAVMARRRGHARLFEVAVLAFDSASDAADVCQFSPFIDAATPAVVCRRRHVAAVSSRCSSRRRHYVAGRRRPERRAVRQAA